MEERENGREKRTGGQISCLLTINEEEVVSR